MPNTIKKTPNGFKLSPPLSPGKKLNLHILYNAHQSLFIKIYNT